MKQKKTKKNSKGKTLKPERFNYWEGWSLYDPKEMKTLFDFTARSKETKEAFEKSQDLIPRGALPSLWGSWNLPKLIKNDIYVLANPEVLTFIDNLRKKCAFDKQSKKTLQEIAKAIKLDLRGRTGTSELKAVIKKDTRNFKELIKRYLEGESVQEIITNPKSLNIDSKKSKL